ncbi:MAG TPA: hypothetical protein VF680_09015 [Allosphingosinicella sp.]|jgi:hypothetical protein
MLLGAALLLALQSAPAVPAAPAPERPMLEAFRTVCDKVDSLDGMKAAALASGWEEISDDAEPRLGRLIRLGKEATKDDGTSSGVNFRRPMNGRTLMLVASRFEDKSGVWGNGCRLYDFDATAAIDPELLSKWMGRDPTGVQELGPTVGLKRLWEPGWRNGMTVEVNHVPPQSKLKDIFGLSGNVLVATALGGF